MGERCVWIVGFLFLSFFPQIPCFFVRPVVYSGCVDYNYADKPSRSLLVHKKTLHRNWPSTRSRPTGIKRTNVLFVLFTVANGNEARRVVEETKGCVLRHSNGSTRWWTTDTGIGVDLKTLPAPHNVKMILKLCKHFPVARKKKEHRTRAEEGNY